MKPDHAKQRRWKPRPWPPRPPEHFENTLKAALYSNADHASAQRHHIQHHQQSTLNHASRQSRTKAEQLTHVSPVILRAFTGFYIIREDFSSLFRVFGVFRGSTQNLPFASSFLYCSKIRACKSFSLNGIQPNPAISSHSSFLPSKPLIINGVKPGQTKSNHDSATHVGCLVECRRKPNHA